MDINPMVSSQARRAQAWVSRLLLVAMICGAASAAPPSTRVESGLQTAVQPVVVTRERHFNYLTWKIEAAGGIWHFEIESAVANASPRHGEAGLASTGFHSAIDREGRDWIGNDCQPNPGGTSREWRGWPNFAGDGFGHPCRGGGGRSRWVSATGEPISFDDRLEGEHLILESWSDNYRLRYHFFSSHAAIEVLEATAPYAFLFEGPVAGQMNVARQRYVLENGVERPFAYNSQTGCGASCLGHLDANFTRNFPSPFFYLVDPEASQVLYIGATGQSAGGDEGWAQASNMVIFSFGREKDKHALSGTSAVSVFGFLGRARGHDSISAFIKARLAAPFSRADVQDGAAPVRP
jgi:hypothetical protein